MTSSLTLDRLHSACEDLLRGASNPEEVTVRSIAARAGTSVGAVSYHFGSLEHLVFRVGERVYLRLNAERLALLQAGVQRANPEPVPAADLIEALVGPSIRWSLDPGSSYGVLRHMTTIAQASHNPEIFRPIIEGIDHHRLFIPHFRRLAPWLSDVDIGFRINCLLGIRTQLTRNRDRTEEMTNHQLDLGDAELVIAHVIAATVPMFTSPLPPDWNSVRKRSRH